MLPEEIPLLSILHGLNWFGGALGIIVIAWALNRFKRFDNIVFAVVGGVTALVFGFNGVNGNWVAGLSPIVHTFITFYAVGMAIFLVWVFRPIRYEDVKDLD